MPTQHFPPFKLTYPPTFHPLTPTSPPWQGLAALRNGGAEQGHEVGDADSAADNGSGRAPVGRVLAAGWVQGHRLYGCARVAGVLVLYGGTDAVWGH